MAHLPGIQLLVVVTRQTSNLLGLGLVVGLAGRSQNHGGGGLLVYIVGVCVGSSTAGVRETQECSQLQLCTYRSTCSSGRDRTLQWAGYLGWAQ